MKKIKRILWVVLALFLFTPNIQAADEWKADDIKLEVLYLGLKTIDWMQTRYASAHPEKYYEVNPLMSRRPSDAEVNQYFLATAIGHIVIAHLLPAKYRKWWQYGFITISSGCIANNINAGIKLKW